MYVAPKGSENTNLVSVYDYASLGFDGRFVDVFYAGSDQNRLLFVDTYPDEDGSPIYVVLQLVQDAEGAFSLEPALSVGGNLAVFMAFNHDDDVALMVTSSNYLAYLEVNLADGYREAAGTRNGKFVKATKRPSGVSRYFDPDTLEFYQLDVEKNLQTFVL